MLHSRKSHLGVGILKLSTIMLILSLKLDLARMKSEYEVSKQTCINEKNGQFQHRFSSNITNAEEKWKPDHKIWSNEITLENAPQRKHIHTRNKSIVDFTIEYVKVKDTNKKDVAPLNYM